MGLDQYVYEMDKKWVLSDTVIIGCTRNVEGYDATFFVHAANYSDGEFMYWRKAYDIDEFMYKKYQEKGGTSHLYTMALVVTEDVILDLEKYLLSEAFNNKKRYDNESIERDLIFCAKAKFHMARKDNPNVLVYVNSW